MRHLNVVFWSLLLAGSLYRLWPVFSGMPDLWTAFLTEDGYLLLTVARNMGIGNGMSVSDGLILSNGVQPLITLLFALLFWITDGDKVQSLVWVHVIHALIALGGAVAIRAFAMRLLAPRDASPAWPAVVALLWFLGPVLLRHSMNGLETGLATLMIVLTLLVLHRRLSEGQNATWSLDLGLGAVAGLTILARIDTGPFIVAIFVAWALFVLVREGGVTQVVTRLVPAGLVTTLIAGPWFLRNLLVFESIMPSSGDAQKLGVQFGTNLPILPGKLFEQAFPMLPLPSVLEAQPALQWAMAGTLVIVIANFVWRMARHMTSPARIIAGLFLIHAVFLAYYYGTVFGAGHFLSRYLAPLAPLMIVAALVTILELGRLLGGRATTLLPALFGWGGTVLCGALLVALAGPLRIPQGHEATVAWVGANVPPDVWVGAPQTGTLGFWHDRTINLDGKVNPEALAAREEGRVLDYVVDSEIDYVIDWAGVGDWVTFDEAQGPGGFAETFELILQDGDRNLSVIARREPRYQGGGERP